MAGGYMERPAVGHALSTKSFRSVHSTKSYRSVTGTGSRRVARSPGSSRSPKKRAEESKAREREAEPLDVADWEFVRMQIHCAINAASKQRTLESAVAMLGDHHAEYSRLSDNMMFALVRNVLNVSVQLIPDAKVSSLCALLDPEKAGHVGVREFKAFLNSAVLPDHSPGCLQLRQPKVLWGGPTAAVEPQDTEGGDRSASPGKRAAVRRASPTNKAKETEWHFDPRNIHDTRVGLVRKEAMERDRKKAAFYRLQTALGPLQTYAVREMLKKAEREISESEASSPNASPKSPFQRQNSFHVKVHRPGKPKSLKETYARLEFDIPLNQYIACLQDSINLGGEAGLNEQELSEAVVTLDSLKQARYFVKAQAAQCAENVDGTPSSP